MELALSISLTLELMGQMLQQNLQWKTERQNN